MTGRSLRRFWGWRLSEVEGVEVVEVVEEVEVVEGVEEVEVVEGVEGVEGVEEVEGVEGVERFITGNVLSYYHTAQKFFCNHTLVTH